MDYRMPYQVAVYATRRAAELALEDMFATGELVAGEQPYITRRATRPFAGGTPTTEFAIYAIG